MSSFKAGAAKVNITPFLGGPMAGYSSRERGSETIDDELYCKALVLYDGETKLAIVTNDLIGVNDIFVRNTRELIEHATGIPKGNVLICASHTHFGPEVRYKDEATLKESDDKFDFAYVAVLQKQMATAVKLANQRLQEAKISVGKGYTDRLSFNRHTIRPDGTAITTYRLPPNEENLTFGPIDPEVGVVRLDSANSEPIVTLINFACHPVCSVDRMYAISADYPGYAMKSIERELGGICLFTLGCAGNIVPIEREGVSKRKIGVALAAEAIKTWQWLNLIDSIKLRAIQKIIELPLKEPKDDKKTREVEIQGLKIRNLYFIGLPGEIFVEIGTGIKEQAGIENLFPVSLANGSVGYIPVAIAYDQGGYESNSTSFAKGSGEMLQDAALELVTKLL
ncbi:hypothetical protein FJZ31_26635 [Candidatus Poribacteria bacterium]|nr:hypothetical protein [Candidatus Poribacteria bacterium]